MPECQIGNHGFAHKSKSLTGKTWVVMAKTYLALLVEWDGVTGSPYRWVILLRHCQAFPRPQSQVHQAEYCRRKLLRVRSGHHYYISFMAKIWGGLNPNFQVNEWKCIFKNNAIKVFVTGSSRCPGTSSPMYWHTWRCPSMFVIPEANQEAKFRASSKLKKPFVKSHRFTRTYEIRLLWTNRPVDSGSSGLKRLVMRLESTVIWPDRMLFKCSRSLWTWKWNREIWSSIS